MGTQAKRLAGKLPGPLGYLTGPQALTRPNNRDRTRPSHIGAEITRSQHRQGRGHHCVVVDVRDRDGGPPWVGEDRWGQRR